MILIVGLGNPGRKYRFSPHNIGYEVIDRLANAHRIALSPSRKIMAELGEGEIAGTEVSLLKPTSFVNLSGEPVKTFLKNRQLDITRDLLVVTDDINLPIGTLRLREKGSHGGHNGLRSIIQMIGSVEFPRLRIGVYPRKGEVYDTATYVLTPLWGEEKKVMGEVTDVAEEAIEYAISDGFPAAMNRYNKEEIGLS